MKVITAACERCVFFDGTEIDTDNDLGDCLRNAKSRPKYPNYWCGDFTPLLKLFDGPEPPVIWWPSNGEFVG